MQQEATLAVRWAWTFDEPDAVTWRAKFTDPPQAVPFRPLLSHPSPMSPNATLKAIREPGAVDSRFPSVGYWRVKLKVTVTWLNGTLVVATASDSVTVNVTVTEQPTSVDLEISSGQSGQALGEDAEETPGAFTVANLNDTDSSYKDDDPNPDSPQNTDSSQNSVPGEQDLMQLVLHKPTGAADEDPVTLTVGAGAKLWKDSTKGTEVTTLVFKAGDLPQTLWVEATAGSTSLRDIVLTMSCNGQSDIVKATAIWATQSGFRKLNPIRTKLTNAAANSNPGSNQIVVTAGAGFSVGDHIIIFSATPAPDGSWPRAGFTVTVVNGTTLSLDKPLGQAWSMDDEVRLGMSAEIDNQTMIDTFVTGGGILGSAHVLPQTNNAMEMQFTVGPPGIGDEPGIVFDISRQRATMMWQKDLGVWSLMYNNCPDGTTVFSPCGFPVGDEVPNDDGPFKNGGQQDEDNTANNNHIYSRDMPNVTFSYAYVQEVIVRHNMLEFVRVRIDSGNFTNINGKVEGSRCSAKVPWHSRIHVIPDPNATILDGFGETKNLWKRDTTTATDNSIDIGHIGLTPR